MQIPQNRKHRQAELVSLMRNQLLEGCDPVRLSREILKWLVRNSDAARAGIWRVDEAEESADCEVLLEAEGGRFSEGERRSAAEFPEFFEAISDRSGSGRILVAPIFGEEGECRFLSVESAGVVREWGREEQELAVAAAGFLGLAGTRRESRVATDLVTTLGRRENQTLVQIASRMGKLGGWSVEVPSLVYRWSGESREIYELGPDVRLSLDELMDFYVPEHRAKVREIFEACAKEGTPFDEEFQLRTGTGRVTWVRIMGEAVRDEAGEIVRVEGAIQDINDRKELEISLGASEIRIRQLVEAMPMIVWMATPAGEVDFFNHHFESYTGWDRNGPVQESWQPFIHPEDLAVCQSRWRESVESGKPYETEARVRGADGEYRWFQLQAVPVRDRDGELLKWYGTAIDIHQAKRLEAEAMALAKRLTTTFESITDGFFTVDLSWNFTYINAEAERLLERTRDGLLGKNVWEEFPHALRAGCFEVFRRSIEENESISLEEYNEDLGKWFEIHTYPSREGLAVYFRDVTERERDREAVRLSEERFRLLSRATNDVIWDWNPEERTLWWNDAFQKIFGWSEDEVKPTLEFWRSLVHPEEREAVSGELVRIWNSKRTSWSSEYRLRRKDGEYAHVLDRGYVIRDAEGKAVRMIGGITDLTGHRKVEEKLREQAELLDKAQDAIVVRGLDHRILFWNKSAERLYGWTGEEAIGRRINKLIYDDAGPFFAATEKTVSKGEWAGEIEHISKTGDVLTVEARWTLVRDEEGRPKSILAINSDVTQSKKLHAQLLRVQRMESIGTLAGGISHDLNNILSPILMGLEFLRAEEKDEQRIKLLDTLFGSARRGVDLVTQVLSFARGVGGKRTVVDVADLVRDLREIVGETFPKNIECRVKTEHVPWRVEADSTQLHQVLMNLCVNARDAMPDGGSLTISIENKMFDETSAALNPESKPGPYVLIRVEDTGTGIPRQILDKIFDPFFTTKEIGKGTGLGLSTVLSIVRGHGGFVNVYSERGKGARFKVYLPAQTESGTIEMKAEDAPKLPMGNGETVLIIDDEEAIRNVTQRTLERFGYGVLLAANGAEAVALYARRMEEIDVVLTDMAMPIMDGPATMIALRSMNPRVKLIGCSGYAANGEMAGVVAAGGHHFIAKPYSSEALLTTLRKVLRGE